jgi:hypothetical protein
VTTTAVSAGTRVSKVNAITLGGFFLIAGALAFVGVFAFLAAEFNYPEVLDGSAAQVLPSLLATGGTGRLIWAIYGFLPLIWIPAGVGAFQALRHVHEGSMRIAMLFAVVSAISMMLGLLRWPSIHWTLAETYAAAAPPDQAVIATVFAGLNSFLGNYIGEFLGELSFSIFFLLSALTMLAPGAGFPRGVGFFGVFTGVAGLIGMFRNVSGIVAPVAAINNYLLPLWMIVFGIALLRYRGPVAPLAPSQTHP